MAAPAVKVVLLDIEGTVCPISFVKDVLFPYALQALPETLRTKWDSPEFTQYRNAFPAEHSGSRDAFAAHVGDLMSRDVKISYLKSLQGYLWENGYKTGELRSPLFPDVAPKFKSWTEREGKRIVIYSSGSVAAQKLLFRHTNGEPADLTPLIADYFDTVNAGFKAEPSSYEKIMSRHPVSEGPAAWLFLSDNVKEVEAAKAAGMQSFVVQRPGNAPLPEDVEKTHRVIYDFNEL
ncbi:acireductone synthase-like protein [Coniochaeta sp. 2T2.1]|nr:acireductone synthase-like protein [Coniochaeta sp. 2T2.1]